MSKISVRDSAVFVTGANRGIGRALVEEALTRGASFVYAAARDTSTLSEAAEQSNGRIIPVELDVTNQNHIAKAAQQAKDTRILINNAGIAGFSGFMFDFSEESARQELEVNYFGPLNVTRAFVKTLIHRKGAVVNMVTVGGLSNFPLAATYSASKAATHSLTQGIRAEMGPHGVSVFGVYPGPIDTDMAAGVEMEKESPANVATRIFDGMEQGVEDITTDKFSDEFVSNLKVNAKAVEKEFSQMAHQPESI